MNGAIKAGLAVVLGLALVSSMISCASTKTSETQGKGFLGEYYKDLGPGPKDGVKERWLKPGINFAKYNKVILEHVVFFFDDASDYKAIHTSELDELAKDFDLAVVNTLKSGGYPVVTEPGPDVVHVRLAITDIKKSKPVVSVITTATMVTPIGLGVNLVKRGATGSWTGTGATKMEIAAYDSMSGQVIAVAKDEKVAGFTERYTQWGSAEEAFKHWAMRLKTFMDEAHGKK